jgi:hypothetical protein
VYREKMKRKSWRMFTAHNIAGYSWW